MARSRKTTAAFPSASPGAATEQIAETETPLPIAVEELTVPFDFESVLLSCPLADPEPGSYVETQSGRIDLRLDRQTQLPGFRRLHAGLRAHNCTFGGGRPVDGPADALRWLCEQLTERTLPAEPNDPNDPKSETA